MEIVISIIQLYFIVYQSIYLKDLHFFATTKHDALYLMNFFFIIVTYIYHKVGCFGFYFGFRQSQTRTYILPTLPPSFLPPFRSGQTSHTHPFLSRLYGWVSLCDLFSLIGAIWVTIGLRLSIEADGVTSWGHS